MSKLIEEIAKRPEMNPDRHDGSYEMVRECLKSLATLKPESINTSDLDMLYLMSIITKTIDEKIRNVKKSSLSVVEKDRMANIIKGVQKKAIDGKYQNYNDNKVVGMFGTGFKTFDRGNFDVKDARKLISLCLDIVKESDEDTILNKTEKTLNSLSGMVGAAGSISQMLHCVHPTIFPVLNSAEFGGRKGFEDLGVVLNRADKARHYIENVRTIRDFRNKNFNFKNYRVIDYYFWSNRGMSLNTVMVSKINENIYESDTSINKRYWVIAPGYEAGYWNDFVDEEIAALGWDYLGDLSKYRTKQDILKELQNHDEDNKSNPSNNALALYNFANEMKVGDIIYARKGTTTILGCGVVSSNYIYDDSREEFKHIRKVKWLKTGNWDLSTFGGKVHYKALTEYTDNKDLIDNINNLIGVEDFDNIEIEIPTSDNYWWLIANPAEWSFDQIEIGGTETFTSHNDQGTERKIYKNFVDAKVDDYVIGYVARPIKAITAICKISREHNGQDIQIEKVMDLKIPIAYSRLKEIEDLSGMEFFKRQIGTLFRLTKDEFDTIMELINEENKPQPQTFVTYTREDFLEEVFFDEEKYEEIASILDYKKNIILCGAPGVGKTFVARRLAYSIMKKKDDSKIEMVQFHQSFSYEDFIQGYRPNSKGEFDLKNGIFYEFCLKAQRDPDNDYYFIIDEINRGNLSKIFGELMMLIECDKRGEDFKISLTYRQEEDEKFYIPENLFLIGTMNTADRSLAMVDYALRRRFSFIELDPAFSTESFRYHLENNGIDEEYIEKVIEGMQSLNEVIAQDNKNLGKGYCIGHSYFCGKPLKNESSEAWYNRIIKFEIKPLLFEYWFDDEETAEEQFRNSL